MPYLYVDPDCDTAGIRGQGEGPLQADEIPGAGLQDLAVQEMLCPVLVQVAGPE